MKRVSVRSPAWMLAGCIAIGAAAAGSPATAQQPDVPSSSPSSPSSPSSLSSSLAPPPSSPLSPSSPSPAPSLPSSSSSPSERDINSQAAVLYQAGLKASGDSQPEEARAYLLAAWRIKHYWQIAGNLADAELTLGRYRDAAEHLVYFLRMAPPNVGDTDRQRAIKMLERARAGAGALRIEVSAPGAEVLVDGVVVGKAPIPEIVFVEPGFRLIEARREGYSSVQAGRDVVAGTEMLVSLRLKPLPAAAVRAEAAGMRTGGTSPADVMASSESSGPNKAVIVTGLALSTIALGTGVATAYISGRGDDKAGRRPDDLRVYAEISTWSLLGGGILGVATGLYALTGSTQAPVVGSVTRGAKGRVIGGVTADIQMSAGGGGLGLRGAW